MEKKEIQDFLECRFALTRMLQGLPEDRRKTLRIFAAAVNDYLSPYGERATITVCPLVEYPEDTVIINRM